MLFIFTNEVKINFQNRKWNYPNRKGSNFSTSGPLIKTSFTRCFTFSPKEFRMDFQKRKYNYSNRKWNHFSNFQASEKKLLLQDVSHFPQGVWDWYSKWEMELFKQEIELFLPLSGRWSKNYFNINFLISNKEFKLIFKTGNGII